MHCTIHSTCWIQHWGFPKLRMNYLWNSFYQQLAKILRNTWIFWSAFFSPRVDKYANTLSLGAEKWIKTFWLCFEQCNLSFNAFAATLLWLTKLVIETKPVAWNWLLSTESTCVLTETLSPVTITAQKWTFPLRNSSINVTKSAWNFGFGHIYWRNLSWKTSLSVQCIKCGKLKKLR